jgi:hypothetical protein
MRRISELSKEVHTVRGANQILEAEIQQVGMGTDLSLFANYCSRILIVCVLAAPVSPQ